jgi:hypothetical protein
MAPEDLAIGDGWEELAQRRLSVRSKPRASPYPHGRSSEGPGHPVPPPDVAALPSYEEALSLLSKRSIKVLRFWFALS